MADGMAGVGDAGRCRACTRMKECRAVGGCRMVC